MHIGQAIKIAPRFSRIDGEPLDDLNYAAGHIIGIFGEDIEVRLLEGSEIFVNFRRVRTAAISARILFDMGSHQYEATVHDCTAVLRFHEHNRKRIRGAVVTDYGTIHPEALDRTLAMIFADL